MNAPSRLAAAFAAARGRTGLIPFLTAGYPSLEANTAMLDGLAALGARAVELGVPFSDPIADGPDIQRSSEHAIRAGVGIPDVLECVTRLRRTRELPVVVMSYANPVLRHGVERFADEARAAGVDGVILSDLPPEELPDVWTALDRAGLDTILLVAPTTDERRLPVLLARSRGFVYCLARTGVTGAGAGEGGSLPERVAALRARTSLPVAVGFGISNAAQARSLAGVADAVIVGAAFMRAIAGALAGHGGAGADAERAAVTAVLDLARDLNGALAG
ncbi:MAG: tryptophan synthase subunit alpha [Candidatus Eisenbacteria bacterium]